MNQSFYYILSQLLPLDKNLTQRGKHKEQKTCLVQASVGGGFPPNNQVKCQEPIKSFFYCLVTFSRKDGLVAGRHVVVISQTSFFLRQINAKTGKHAGSGRLHYHEKNYLPNYFLFFHSAKNKSHGSFVHGYSFRTCTAVVHYKEFKIWSCMHAYIHTCMHALVCLSKRTHTQAGVLSGPKTTATTTTTHTYVLGRRQGEESRAVLAVY